MYLGGYFYFQYNKNESKWIRKSEETAERYLMLHIMWTQRSDEADYLLGKQGQQFSVTNCV